MADDGINALWSLHFDQDGVEDVAVSCDADGEGAVHSRYFWRRRETSPRLP